MQATSKPEWGLSLSLGEYRMVVKYVSKFYRITYLLPSGPLREEFGEQAFHNHDRLNEANIRPFVAIKPPATESWTIRDR